MLYELFVCLFLCFSIDQGRPRPRGIPSHLVSGQRLQVPAPVRLWGEPLNLSTLSMGAPVPLQRDCPPLPTWPTRAAGAQTLLPATLVSMHQGLNLPSQSQEVVQLGR